MGTEPGDREGRPGTVTGLVGDREGLFLLALVLVLFDLVKLSFVEYSASDENIYFYMGKLVSEGLLPYRDFRFAHPPLKLVPAAAVFWIFGGSFTALKMIPVLGTNVSAACIYLFLRRILSPLHAVVGAAVFLFSFAGLFYTSYFMGTNLTVTLLLVGFLLLYRKRDVLAGVFFGMALMMGIYAACAILALGIWCLAADRARLRGLLLGGAITFVGLNLLCLAIGGGGYLKHVYLFHFEKTEDLTAPKDFTIVGIIRGNPIFLAAAAAYPFFRRRAVDPWFFSGVAFLLFFLVYPSIHDYYFLLAAPFLAVPAALTFLGLLGRLRLSPAGLALFAALGLALFGVRNHESAREGVIHGAIPQAPQMAEVIRNMLPPDGAVFGMAEVAPLMALLSGREILDRHVDTNGKVYMTGMVSLDDVMRSIDTGRPVVVITKERIVDERSSIFYGPMTDEAFRVFLWQRFDVGYTWVFAQYPRERILFYVRRPPPGRGGGG